MTGQNEIITPVFKNSDIPQTFYSLCSLIDIYLFSLQKNVNSMY